MANATYMRKALAVYDGENWNQVNGVNSITFYSTAPTEGMNKGDIVYAE
jgi:hypothetical protein